MTPGTWLRTLVHLTPRQVLYQGIRRLRGPARRPASTTREGLHAIATPMPPPAAEGVVEAAGVRLLEHPATMSHLAVNGSELEVPRELVRISVGIEDADDLIADLEQAIAAL